MVDSAATGAAVVPVDEHDPAGTHRLEIVQISCRFVSYECVMDIVDRILATLTIRPGFVESDERREVKVDDVHHDPGGICA